MSKPVITIARQYGSGGKTIGQMLADDLKVNCYEREIISMASEDSGINESLFAKVDEQIGVNSFFNLNHIYKGKLISPESDGFTSNQNLFNYQAKIIKYLADKDSCVIIGRCANFVLRDNPDVVSVFVYSDADFLLENALERTSFSEKDTIKFIEKTNKYRADYYKYYTGLDWYDLRSYDLVLNSGKLGFDGCKEAIKAYMNIRFSKS